MSFRACCGLLAGSNDDRDDDYDGPLGDLPLPTTSAMHSKGLDTMTRHNPPNSVLTSADQEKTYSESAVSAESEAPFGGGMSLVVNSQPGSELLPPTQAMLAEVPIVDRTVEGITRYEQARLPEIVYTDVDRIAKENVRSEQSSTQQAGLPPEPKCEPMQVSLTVDGTGPNKVIGMEGQREVERKEEVSEALSPAQEYNLVGFVNKLSRGVLVTKINRQGRFAVRMLRYDPPNQLLWWNEPGAPVGGGGHKRSKSLLSFKKEKPLNVALLVEVKLATAESTAYYMEEDLDKTFQLIFPSRSVNIVAKDAKEARELVQGFKELKKSIRIKR